MACGCARRMRTILEKAHYELEDGVWRKDDHEIPDDRVEEKHFKVLIETMGRELSASRVTTFFKTLEGK